jgi:glycosyltransferase involved in cell wall biosynthesis
MTEILPIFPGGFSVLLVIYYKDSAELFSRALSSIFANTLQPNEVVLIANGALLQGHEDVLNDINNSDNNKNVNLIRLDKNIGLAGALNIGIQQAKYKWIVRADPDDYNLPCRFSLLANMLVNDANLGLIGSYVGEKHEKDDEFVIRKVPLNYDDIKNYCRYRNPFNHMTVAFERSAALDCGGYPYLYLREDYGLWAKLLARGINAANLDNVLVIAMNGSKMISRRGGFKYALHEYEIQRLLQQLGYKSRLTAIQHGCLRAIIFLAPFIIRSFVYKRFLRKV